MGVIIAMFWLIIAIVVLVGVLSGFFTVQQQSRAIVERFGR